MQPRPRGHGPLNLAFVIDGTVRYKLTKNPLRGARFPTYPTVVFCDDGLYISARNIDGRSHRRRGTGRYLTHGVPPVTAVTGCWHRPDFIDFSPHIVPSEDGSLALIIRRQACLRRKSKGRAPLPA